MNLVVLKVTLRRKAEQSQSCVSDLRMGIVSMFQAAVCPSMSQATELTCCHTHSLSLGTATSCLGLSH